MTFSTLKQQRAFELIASSEDISRFFKQIKKMKRETIYLRLASLGYIWDTAKSAWRLAIPKKETEISAVVYDDATDPTYVHIRVMCSERKASKVVEDLKILLPYGDFEVEKVSEPRKNRDGDWVRVYIKAKHLTS